MAHGIRGGLERFSVVPVDPERVPNFVQDFVRAVNERIEEIDRSFFVFSYREPDKLDEGMIRLADGTSWDPGSGKGLYQYLDGAWVKL